MLNIFQTKKSNQQKFVTEEHFHSNLNKQKESNHQTLEQLKKYNISENQEKKLEYFFYTNSIYKAQAFAKELEKYKYDVKYQASAGNSNEFIITGWTTKMTMSEEVVLKWAEQMCELGYKYDCDFDGWGTNTD